MISGKADCLALLLALLTRIGPLSNQCSRLIAARACIAQAHLRIAAEGHALLLAFPVKPKVPEFGALGRDVQNQSIVVGERVVFAYDSGMPNRHFRKSHGDLLNLSEAKCSSRPRSCSIEKPNWGLSHSGLTSGLKMPGY
ncbi:hypothetical protein D9M71_592190 [compost metagenome]